MKQLLELSIALFSLFWTPLFAQGVEELTTEKILTIPPNSRTRFNISHLAENGTYFLRAISQNKNPIVFYVYESDPFTLLASNHTKADTYEETLTLTLSKDKSYQVIFSSLRATNQAIRFSLVKSSINEAFTNLAPTTPVELIKPSDDTIRSTEIAKFTADRPVYDYETAMHNDTLYLAYQERVAGRVVIAHYTEDKWEIVGDAATGNQEKVSSFKLTISSEGKIYLAFLSSPVKGQIKLNVVTYNGFHWVDISPSVTGALGDLISFNIHNKILSLLYALPLSQDTYTLQVLTNQGFGREWLALSPLEPSEKVTLEGLTTLGSPNLMIAYNALVGRDKLSRIMSYRNSHWANLEAPAQVNATLHNLVNVGNTLVFADITAKGVPSVQLHQNNSWHSVPLKYEFTKPLSFSVAALENGPLFLAFNSLNNFTVLVTRDRKVWQFVGGKPYAPNSAYSQFVPTDGTKVILAYQRGRDIIFNHLELR